MNFLILGNGFDLACGLPTRYSNYFDYLYKINEKMIKRFDKITQIEQKSKYSYSYLSSQSTSARHSLISDEIEVELADMMKLIDKWVDDSLDISVWDLYFWFSKKNANLSNFSWANIEKEISTTINSDKRTILKNKYQITLLEEQQIRDYLYNSTRFSYPNISDSTQEKKYVDNVFFYLKSEELAYYVCQKILEKRYSKITRNIHECLLFELNMLEKSFMNYINGIMSVVLEKSNRSKYRKNLSQLIDLNSNRNVFDDTFILNFNYTDLSLSAKTSDFKARVSNNDVKFTQMNVHGVYYNSIIFGVDQNNVEANSKEYIFTKTFRKMILSDQFDSIDLPKPNEVNSIIICGHSLSEADYSYFLSLFDYLNIYSSDIKIIVFYSNYLEENEKWIVRNREVGNITKLLEKYGMTMGNNDKGKNLVHKLLIENRLHIKNIKLDKYEERIFTKVVNPDIT